MYQTKVVEKINTHFMFSNFFFPKNQDVCEVMWKNVIQLGRPQMTVWHIHFA